MPRRDPVALAVEAPSPWYNLRVVSDAVRSAIQAVAEAVGGVELLVVFGSMARGTEQPTSDIDVAVAGRVDPLALAARLSVATRREVDVVEIERATIPLLDAIVREGVVVYEGVPDAEARFRARALSILETDRPWYERMQNAWLKRVSERGILG